MRRPKQQTKADSTLSQRARRKLVLKFFASLCLLGFLMGLMLGDFFKPVSSPIENKLLSVSAQKQGLTLCFVELPSIDSGQSQGVYWLSFMHALAQPQKGELQIEESLTVRWQLEQRRTGLQLGFVALERLQGQWRQLDTQGCVEIQLSRHK